MTSGLPLLRRAEPAIQFWSKTWGKDTCMVSDILLCPFGHATALMGSLQITYCKYSSFA